MLGRLRELFQAVLHGVDEGADRVLLVSCERFADQGLHVWRELYVHGAHAVFHEPAESLHDSVLLHKLHEEPVDEGPELDEQVGERVDLLVYAAWEPVETLEQVS